MRDDLDARVGEIFRRLSLLRLELGEGAMHQAVQDVLQALGVAAHRVAEDRARFLAARTAPRTRSVAVTPFADRRPDDNGFD